MAGAALRRSFTAMATGLKDSASTAVGRAGAARSFEQVHEQAHALIAQRKSLLGARHKAVRTAHWAGRQDPVRTSVSGVTALDEITRPERFSRNVKLARALADMTQDQLAERLGMYRNHVSRLENGHEPRSHARLVLLAEIFELPDWSWFYEAHPQLEAMLTPGQRRRVGL